MESETDVGSTWARVKAVERPALPCDGFIYDPKGSHHTVTFAPRDRALALCRFICISTINFYCRISTINVNVHTYTLPTIT